MIARRENFLCDRCVRPQVDLFGYQRTPVDLICGPLAELGRRSCGADVAGWLNATVPFQALPGYTSLLFFDSSSNLLGHFQGGAISTVSGIGGGSGSWA
jgi:Rhodococcus equi virulence-associated protein